MAKVEFLEPHQLACILRSEDKETTVVLDVRDDDYAGGHIRGSINVPSDQFSTEQLLDLVVDAHCTSANKVVLHCMFSQQRGPRCATQLLKRLQQRNILRPDVYVLKGGWVHFVRNYKNDKDLVEDVTQAYF